MTLAPRHIQDWSTAAFLEPHWGYADRVIPCTNDRGSCEYLDVVYSAHDQGMIYSGIFWLTIGGVLLVWALGRRIFPAREPVDDLIAQLSQQHQNQPSPSLESQLRPPPKSTLTRAWTTLRIALRSYLLPTTPLRPLFGTATRLQLVILCFLIAYLTLWSFLGMTYAKWVTPVKNQPNTYNTRTTLGPWADRIGVLAYALTPLSVLLASRENILSLLTGIPYTSFMFLHRWTGYIILIQSLLHTLGWTLVEAWLYQPQPAVWNAWVGQLYAIWGFVALGLLLLLWVLTWGVVTRLTGYEFFRKAHYVLAMVYIGALIGHWGQLQCFLVPGILLWGLDRFMRLVRMGMLHSGYSMETGGWGFRALQADAKIWKDAEFGDVVRLDFAHVQKPWKIGQHFFLCFPESSIWQSHPFTPLSLPIADGTGRVRHSYVFRAKGGESKKVASLLAKKLAESTAPTTPLVIQGPYGENVVEGLTQDKNVLCVAGGSGITFVLPILLRLAREKPAPGRKIELVWAVKRKQDLQWVEPEMEQLRRLGAPHGLRVRTFVTAETVAVASERVKVTGEKGKTESEDESDSVQEASVGSGNDHRPDVTAVVNDFVSSVAHGSTRVFGSGPPGMVVDLRAAVAGCNVASRVWKGEERFDVRLVCDDRLE
ncbi:putative FAD binding protein [Parathielavia appendiculata]|uniref:FAD binding protein n=1 Tax=Parathielavia appendiculata TaxID=2587402 RepID=A0AAN6Z718_9PEZI|nr:putative FAD binding protein [Parathielavia appendiculata]